MSTADKDLNEGTLTCFTFFKEEKRKKGTKKRVLRKNLFIFIFCFCVCGNWERFKCREGLWPQFFLKVFLLFTCKLLCPPFPYYSPPQYPHHHSLPRFPDWQMRIKREKSIYCTRRKFGLPFEDLLLLLLLLPPLTQCSLFDDALNGKLKKCQLE